VGSKECGERLTIDREFSFNAIIAIFFDQTQINESLMTAGINHGAHRHARAQKTGPLAA
jgi:hypothetical protein